MLMTQTWISTTGEVELKHNSALVIEIGGTRLRIGLLSCNQPLINVRVPSAYTKLLEKISQFCEENPHRESELRTIYVATPGLVRPDGSVYSALYSCTANRELRADLMQAVGVETIVWNDANAQAEGAYGELGGVAIYITIGTGVGGAVLSEGKAVNGARGFTGEFGHINILGNGITCRCGKRGCVDAIASGHSLIQDHGELWYKSPEQSISDRLNLAGTAIADLAELLAAALDPDIIAINGHVSLDPRFRAGFDAKLAVTKNACPIYWSNSAWEFTVRWARKMEQRRALPI